MESHRQPVGILIWPAGFGNYLARMSHGDVELYYEGASTWLTGVHSHSVRLLYVLHMIENLPTTYLRILIKVRPLGLRQSEFHKALTWYCNSL